MAKEQEQNRLSKYLEKSGKVGDFDVNLNVATLTVMVADCLVKMQPCRTVLCRQKESKMLVKQVDSMTLCLLLLEFMLTLSQLSNTSFLVTNPHYWVAW